MVNPRLDHLPDYAFPRLHALLDGIEPGGSGAAINMSLGEPKHPYPAFVADVLSRHRDEYALYPPIAGTPEFRQAVADWLTRRYGLRRGVVDPEHHVLPLNGTREGLFNIALVAVPPDKGRGASKVLIPNPFYQCYAAAAALAGGEALYVPALAENGFLPDFEGQPAEVLDRTALVYLCSPANPQGTVAGLGYLKSLVELARRHDFVLVVDECYAEIYTQEPPPGGLEAAAAIDGNAGNPFRNVLVFHSLSKRSNLPGLRSGFVAGDADLIERFRRLRSYGGAPSPLPVYHAATAAWSDETHVEKNRALYREKFDTADQILGDRFGYVRPPGGFYAWLDVGDSEAATVRLWREAGVKVLPGRYLAWDCAMPDGRTGNPGAPYIRVALVLDRETTAEGLKRIVDTLGI